MNFRKIDDNYSVAGQITPDEVAAVRDAGFGAIVCVRPDHEEAGQPTFDAVAAAAEAAGLPIVHIPVSGMLLEEQVARFHQAWEELPKPIFAYCRSGARAVTLYQTLPL